MAFSFKEYHRRRDEVADYVNQIKQATGYETQPGKRDLTTQAAIDAAKKGGDVYSKGSETLGHGMNAAASLATGNMLGAAYSIWKTIQGLASAPGTLRGFSQAGALVPEIIQLKAELTKFLSQKIDPANVKRAADAIFEVDIENAQGYPPDLWPQAIKTFTSRLASGYHDLDNKTFAAACYDELHKYLSAKYGAHADALKRELASLLQEKQQAAAVVAQPQIQAAVAQFQPNGQDVPVAQATGRPTTREELEALPKKSSYKKGEIVYRYSQMRGKITMGVVVNQNQSGLYVFDEEGWNSNGDSNPEGIRSIGETLDDVKGTPFYEKFIKFARSGRIHGMDHWGDELGLPDENKFSPEKLGLKTDSRHIKVGDMVTVEFKKWGKGSPVGKVTKITPDGFSMQTKERIADSWESWRDDGNTVDFRHDELGGVYKMHRKGDRVYGINKNGKTITGRVNADGGATDLYVQWDNQPWHGTTTHRSVVSEEEYYNGVMPKHNLTF